MISKKKKKKKINFSIPHFNVMNKALCILLNIFFDLNKIIMILYFSSIQIFFSDLCEHYRKSL